MNTMEAVPLWAAIPVAFLLVLGGFITLVGALGLIRLKNFYQRIHGPAITITLGTGCLLIASMIYFTVLQSRLVVHELLITAFVLLTAPVVSLMIMRSAVHRDLRTGLKNDEEGIGDAYLVTPDDYKDDRQPDGTPQ